MFAIVYGGASKMKSFSSLLILLFAAACANSDVKVHLPSPVYTYVKIDTTAFATKRSVYVPVYSHIYIESGKDIYNLAATLSIRNSSFIDSFYVTGVNYYGSQGEILKRYLDSAILIRPMSSAEFVVERVESEGGAGANFVVKWGGNAVRNEPIIQAVMIESARGISFVTNGVDIR
jgi:hypothetical protein